MSELSYGNLLSQAKKIYVKSFQTIFIFALILSVWTGLASLYSYYDLASQGMQISPTEYQKVVSGMSQVNIEQNPTLPSLLFENLLFVPTFIFSLLIIVNGFTYLTSNKPSLSKSYQKLNKTIWKFIFTVLAFAVFMLIVGFLVALVVLLLTFVFQALGIVTGVIVGIITIIFLVYIAFYYQAILIREKSFLDAFSYSYSLVKNHWWQTFFYLLLSLILGFLLLVPFLIIGGLTLFSLEGYVSLFVANFVIALGSYLIQYYFSYVYVALFLGLEHKKHH